MNKTVMHKNSLRIMRVFIRRYVRGDRLLILDVGSQVVNSRRLGSYRELFSRSGWWYVGVDIVPGENVDMVIEGHRLPYPDGSVDVVVSGSAFEHMEFPWEMIREVSRVLRPGGLCCIVAPYDGGEHRIPIDTYRYFPDGMRALAKWAGLEVVEAAMFKIDTYLVARRAA